MIDNDKITAAEKCLIDNGIDPDEASIVLQAIGYILLDTELYPDTERKIKKAINIQWDIDPEEQRYMEEENITLPNEIEIPEGMIDEEQISDYITDYTGFCHNGFELI